MKKIALMGALALCLGFTSCDNYEEPNPPAQSNPQDAVLVANGLSVAPGASVVDEAGTLRTISLEQYNNEGTPISVASIDYTEPFPADCILKVVMQISKTDDFASVQELATDYENNVVSVAAKNLQEKYLVVMGKSPAAQNVYARFAVYAVDADGNTQARIGGPDFFYGPITLNILPYPADFTVENSYYLVGTVNNWNVAQAVKFVHSDINPYDDPVFTLAVDITADQADAGWEWQIIPESTYVTGGMVAAKDAAFGVEYDGDDVLAGSLVGRTETENCGTGVIYEKGTYILTINMEQMTYEFSEAYPNFYTPGPANGWGFTDNMLLYTSDYINYQGYVFVDDMVKFTSEDSWSAKYNLGAGADPGTLANGSNDNILVDEDGLYWITLNLPNLTYTMTMINSIGVIGDATPAGWDADTDLTASADGKTWTGTITFKTGEFKFRANGGWDINLGGDMNDLQQNGDNLASPGAGTYDVTLNLGSLPYTCTLVSK